MRVKYQIEHQTHYNTSSTIMETRFTVICLFVAFSNLRIPTLEKLTFINDHNHNNQLLRTVANRLSF